jgi:hypothetical protein
MAFPPTPSENWGVEHPHRRWTVASAFAVIAASLSACAGDPFAGDEATMFEAGTSVTTGGGSSPLAGGEAGHAGPGTDEPDAGVNSDEPEASIDQPEAASDAHPAIDACASNATAGACPSEIPPLGLLLWLDANVGVESSDGRVASWRDRSGLKNDATQQVADYRPTLAASWHAGKPAIEFDGSARFLAMPTGFADFTGGLTIFEVAEISVDTMCASFLSLSNGGESDDISLHRMMGDEFEYECLDQSFATQPNEQPVLKPSLMTVVHHTDTRLDLYTNGALSGETMIALPATVHRAKNELGRSSYVDCAFLNGHIAEVVLYARDLSDEERVAVEAYLRKKWSL